MGWIIDYLLPALMILSVLIFVHELGHYLLARLFRVKIEVFSIGFGKEIFGFNDNRGTRWRFSVLPLGGYVKFKGESIFSTEGKENQDPDSYIYQHPFKRLLILFAGPFANFLLAIIVFLCIYVSVGRPYLTNEIGAIIPNSAAQSAGILVNDRILSIDGEKTQEFNDISYIIALSANKDISLEIERGQQILFLSARPQARDDGFGNDIGFLGVSPARGAEFIPLGIIEALVFSVRDSFTNLFLIMQGIKNIFISSSSLDNLGGPVRIAELIGDFWEKSFIDLLFFTSILSMNLALLNMLPFPPLDGGGIVFCVTEIFSGRKIGLKIQEISYRIGFLLLFALLIMVTWNDLLRVFTAG